MGKKHCTFPVTDFIFQWVRRWVWKYRWSLWGTIGGGLLAYVFAFTNKLPNFDDVAWIFGKGVTLESGRWGLVPLSVIFPDYSMPWICGVMALMILSVGICLIVEIFDIQTPLAQMLLSAAITCYPSWICTYTYTIADTAAIFNLWRTPDDLIALLDQAGKMGVTRAIGLYQQLKEGPLA